MGVRKQSEADMYHIVARGTGRQIIFEDDDDRHLMHALFHKHLTQEGIDIYAWCFMGNHVHILLHGPITEMSAQLKIVFEVYAVAFNRKYGRTGHLFQGAFKSEPIDDENYLVTALRYIHQNPLKAGLSDSCHWAWSSFEEYYGSSALPCLCNRQYVLELFGGREWFLRFHEVNDGPSDFLDVAGEYERGKTRAMADKQAIELAEECIGLGGIESIKSWPKDKRNAGIISLHDAGLTIRQIERLTGISRGVIYRTLQRKRNC